MDRRASWATVHGVARVGHDLVTKPPPKTPSGLPFPPSGDLPNPGSEPGFLALQANLYRLSHQGIPFLIKTWIKYILREKSNK